jgi:hypothetical protein
VLAADSLVHVLFLGGDSSGYPFPRVFYLLWMWSADEKTAPLPLNRKAAKIMLTEFGRLVKAFVSGQIAKSPFWTFCGRLGKKQRVFV